MNGISRYEKNLINKALEADVSKAGAEYERYLLAEAYDHAAMRRRTRREALELVSRKGNKAAKANG